VSDLLLKANGFWAMLYQNLNKGHFFVKWRRCLLLTITYTGVLIRFIDFYCHFGIFKLFL
jgi:hypothetical protein